MTMVQCPTCSLDVESATGSCPSCGGDLPATLSWEHRITRPLEFTPGQKFANRYTIVEQIGRGGMGVVYKAIDNEVGSEVALKLIHPELTGMSTFADRFRREARVTRQITHPNVCRVHDIADSNGILHLSMEWIEGETLQQLLRQTGKLNERRALQIARKIALALRAAHAKGIVHRDLKPANVMIDTTGEVHVLDFGLALETDAESLSESGIVVGTVLYMSPEQRRGDVVDRRTDLFALGLILCEMLTGRPIDASAAPEMLCSETRPAVARLLARLLARRREDRHQSAGAVVEDLDKLLAKPAPILRIFKKLAMTAAALVAAGVAIYVIVIPPKPPPPTPPIQDPRAHDFYERGLHHLRENLETVRGLDDARQMFLRALGHEPESPAIMARLAEVYWHRYEKAPSAESQAEAEHWLRQSAAAGGESMAEFHNAKGYGHIAQGDFDSARTEFELATAERPDFAAAWANLGLVRQHRGEYAEGLAALDRAMELERGSFRMQLYRGDLHWHFGEYEEAARYYRGATELKSDSAMAWSNLGGAKLYLGQVEEAIEALLRSIGIEDNALARTNLGFAYYSLERYEDATEHFRRAAELDPAHPAHLANLGDTLWVLGRLDEAREAYAGAARAARERVERDPELSDAKMRLGLYCALSGDEACALEHSRAALQKQPDNTSFVLKMALIHCVLRRDDESLEWLDRAVKLGASKAQIQNYPHFSRLQKHPRFLSILELAS